jgi:SAM-dependent methyltransferase
MGGANTFWESPERVEEFADRPPDQRLSKLLDAHQTPARVRVLDLGCAGGRNAVLLAEKGFDFFAIDTSTAMVEKTRARVAEVLGEAEARERVWKGRMSDLGAFASEYFELVVALGIYHSAESQAEWDRAVSETARVLAPGGQVLVASFSPRSAPTGKQVRAIPGEPHLYGGFDSGPLYLLEAGEMDAGMAQHGLRPVVPSRTVEVSTESGRRVTANALYSKV